MGGWGEITSVPRWVEVGSDDSGPLVGRRIRGIGRTDNFDRLAAKKSSKKKFAAWQRVSYLPPSLS